MHEVKCPHCGEVFTVNEDAYASIVDQIKNSAFNEEVHNRLEEQKKIWESQEANRVLKTKSEYEKALSDKERAISELENKVKTLGTEKDLQYQGKLSELNLKIQGLENSLEAAGKENERNIQEARREEREKADGELKKKDEDYGEQLRLAQEEIDRLTKYKKSLATKVIGESLEVFCHEEFEANLRPMLPKAYFEKDNDVVDGTKADFIFRDYADDGTEYISITFEMKNESDETDAKHKHKNEDFLKKLDEDRRKKKCDYAVLVSMLEQDSALYNRGIVDVSHKYPKMYVVRPQFFIPIITLLMNAEKRNIAIRQKLAVVENDDKDFTTFEANLRGYVDKFTKHRKDATANFNSALKQIDDAIANLQKIRGFLEKADTQLGQAESNLEDMLDFKKVTKGAPSILPKLEEAQKANAKIDEQ